MKCPWYPAAAALVALFCSTLAIAQDYPKKVVTLIVPFAAGGPTDTVARLIGQSMSTDLGQQIIVENVAGAGGTIAAAKVARATPDGYTIFIHHIGHATAPALYKKLPYDTITDFESIGLVTDVPMTLVAKKDFPPNTLKELIALLKTRKDNVSFGSAGSGAVSHLCGLLFMSAIETELNTVQYKGTGPVMNDLMGGQIDLTCDQTTNTTGPIRAGKVKAYGVTTKTRVGSLKELPTLNEAGLPNFEISAWHGLYAPKGTPKPVIDRLSKSLQVALKDPTVVARFADLGTEPVAQQQATPQALAAHLKSEVAKWEPIIKKAGVYAN